MSEIYNAKKRTCWKQASVGSALWMIALTSLALSGCTLPPPPPTQEIRWTFGGDVDDEAVAVRETSDGGYVVAGTTGDNDEGTSAIIVLKLDSSGRQVWARTFQGDSYDAATTLLRLPGDKFVVIGTTDVFNGLPDRDGYTSYDSHAYAVCVDGNGTTLWEKTYGTEYPEAAAVTTEGDLVVGGRRSSASWGFYLSRISSEGELLWIKDVGDEDAFIQALQSTSDGDIIFAGVSDEGSYLAKADGDGNLLWERSIIDERIGIVSDLMETSQGDYALLSYGILVKTNENGNTLWTSEPINDRLLSGRLTSIAEASDGGYILAGTFDYGLLGVLFPDDKRVAGMYLVKADTNGHEVWARVYTKRDQGPVANFVEVAEDGGYILAGHDGGVPEEDGEFRDNYDIAIVKTDANGDIE